MKSAIFKILILLGFICSSTAFSVAITPCKAEDSNCIKQSAQAFVPILAVGIPEFGAKSLDPLHIPLIDASGGDLKMHTTDMVVTGMKGCSIPDASRDKAKHSMYVEVQCTVDVQAHYDINGKVLHLPVNGSGGLSVQLYDILIKQKSYLKDVERDGKTYWNVDTWDFTWVLKGHATVALKDLFGGNSELSKSMSEMLKESSDDIINQFGHPIVNAITTEVVEAIKQLLDHVPAEDLSLD